MKRMQFSRHQKQHAQQHAMYCKTELPDFLAFFWMYVRIARIIWAT